MSDLTKRLLWAGIALLVTFAVGATGFWVLGDGRWGFGECLYMTLVSATTVGYGETLPGMEQMPLARAWAATVILLGIGVFGFAASMLTAWIVESDLRERFRKKRMHRQIEHMSGHVIVCGVGSTGRHVVKEMLATQTPVVAIDQSEEQIASLVVEVHPQAFPYLVGDATDDSVLEQAGISRAKGLVTTLPSDKDNLFTVVTAHGINASMRIVARGHDLRVAEKLKKAGATSVVSPNFIGGMRLASEMLRPNVVAFLDEMLRDRDKNLRIEEVEVRTGSPAAGKSIRDARLREQTEALVLAIRGSGRHGFHYNPGPDAVLDVGAMLMVLGTQDAVSRLRVYMGA